MVELEPELVHEAGTWLKNVSWALELWRGARLYTTLSWIRGSEHGWVYLYIPSLVLVFWIYL